MNQKNISFIGAGNIARALISGLIANQYEPKKIWVSNPNRDKLNDLEQKFAVNATANNLEAIQNSEIIVLCVKPQHMSLVCSEISEKIKGDKKLIISVATGITVKLLEKKIGFHHPIIRAMPNTPAMVNAGATCLFANSAVTENEKSIAESIFRTVGLIHWIMNENDMNIVTALSGSGPAYIFLVMEAMQEAAKNLGLSSDLARLLTLQTALGASRLALESEQELEQLRLQITSPQGTTQSAIAVLEQGQLKELFRKAITAACERSKELAASFSHTKEN